MSVIGHRLRAYVRPSAFSPTDISGLFAWYDASHAASFTYSSGVVVSQWNDRSGNGYHLTQGTVANQPSRNGTQNSLDTVVFDGTNDSMEATPTTPDAATVFFVQKAFGATGLLFGTPSGRAVTFTGSAIKVNHHHQAELLTCATNVGTTAYQLLTTTYSTTAAAGRLNRVADGSATYGARTWTATAGFCIGGNKPTPDYWTNTAIGEIIVYNSVLGSTDIDSVETYLRDKWGTA